VVCEESCTPSRTALDSCVMTVRKAAAVCTTASVTSSECRGLRKMQVGDHRKCRCVRVRLGGGGDGRSADGDHLLVEKVGHGDGLVAVRACSSKPNATHPGVAGVAALFAESSVAAGVAFVDGDGPSGLGLGHDERRGTGVASAPVGGGSAGVGAEFAAAAGGVWLLADGAAHRDGIVTRRGRHDRPTAVRVASARARWLRIR